jgi:endonuclease G
MCVPTYVEITEEVTVMDTIVVDDTTSNYGIVETVRDTTVNTIKGDVVDTIVTTITETIKVAVSCRFCEFIPIENLELPETQEGDEVVSHIAYSLLFNDAHKQADWVAYLLTAERATPVVDRKDSFCPDPAIKTGSAVDADYKYSGFDRGHLAPCADMRWSDTVMKESFFFSNMSPQRGQLNQQTWAKLEELVRNWAKEYDTLYIATGPVLRDGLPFIEETEEAKSNYKPVNKVTVPEYYYKVVLHYTSKEIKGIGFIVPNKNGMGKSIQMV